MNETFSSGGEVIINMASIFRVYIEEQQLPNYQQHIKLDCWSPFKIGVEVEPANMLLVATVKK